MGERIGIVAVAQTSYEAAHDQWRSHELTYHTVEKVLEETRLIWAKDGTGIDATVSCSNWIMEGSAISNHCVAWLDEGVALYHYLGVRPDSEEESKLQRGLRIEIEMKPIEERSGVLEDIKYFNVMWDEPMKKE